MITDAILTFLELTLSLNIVIKSPKGLRSIISAVKVNSKMLK